MARVKHPSHIKYLCKHTRDELAAFPGGGFAGVYVGNREPPAAAGTWDRAVIIRVDGSVRTSLVTREVTLGVRCRAGQDLTDEEPAEDLALTVLAILEDCPGLQTGNPVTAVLNSNGPFSVTEEGSQPTQYFTITLAVAGEALN